MYFYKEIVIFYSRLFENTHQNASIVERFQTFLHEKYHIASVYLYKKWYFLKFLLRIWKFLKKCYMKNDNLKKKYIKNGDFKIFLKTKSDPNMHQIAPFKKIFSGGACPKPP